jgi:isoaspartyl peptidase/L-asparaginase-like protein (Ntn-hydrolase superfamily)
MRTCVSFLIVECIRNGMTAQDACVEGVKRVLRLKPRKPSVETMSSKLVIGVVAMDIHGNVCISFRFILVILTFSLDWSIFNDRFR